MSEVFDRLLCASANGVRAPIDADDGRELIDLYEQTPDEHPKPEGPFHLNEYLTNRAFGGPEEGGWWYDTGTFVACHGTYLPHGRRHIGMANTVNKHIRVDPNDWKRIEKAARERSISPTRLMISTTLEAIDRRQWPHTEAEIYLLRSAMFAAQAIARDMEAAGRGDEIAAIARNVSKVAPELPPDSNGDTDERVPPDGIEE